MGTRSLLIVKYKKKIKVAQYAQWDGYLTGQGKDLQDILKGYIMINFKDKLKNVSFYKTTKERNDKIKQVGQVFGEDFDLSLRMPEISRDTGVKILSIIGKTHEKLKLDDNRSFLKDGLFCEFAYELNLDNDTITVYTNGNNKVLTTTIEDYCKLDLKALENKLNGEEEVENV
jgi:hypothetical protein